MNEWAQYLAAGGWKNNSAVLYHMLETSRLQQYLDGNDQYYFPPTYQQDGFIHATGVASVLMDVANHFYRGSTEEWVCLEIDPNYLNCKVIYELPAPVGNKASHQITKDNGESVQETGPLFPHIYGGINKLSIRGVRKIIRNKSGEFLSIQGL
jgi:uncharacterized protein (DUF952 family)